MVIYSLNPFPPTPVYLGFHLNWAGYQHCLLFVCVWFLWSCADPSLYGVGCRGHVPCCGGHKFRASVECCVSSHTCTCMHTCTCTCTHALTSHDCRCCFSRQVVGIVIVLVGEMIQVPLSDELIKINQCLGPSVTNDSSIPSCFRPSHNSSIPSVIRQSTELTDSSNTIIFCLVLTVLNFMFFVLCFCPKYKRMDSENKASFEKSLYN